MNQENNFNLQGNNGMPNNGLPNNGIPNNMQNGGLPNNMPQGNGMPKPGKTPKVKKDKLQNVSKFSHSRNVIFIILLSCESGTRLDNVVSLVSIFSLSLIE